jgi:hypothetical protein
MHASLPQQRSPSGGTLHLPSSFPTPPPCRRVIKKSELREAIREMLDTPGPFLLDVMVPHVAHVLPMIPGGGSFKDTITEGDGSQKY